MKNAHARNRPIGPLFLGFVALVLTAVMIVVSGGVPTQASTGGVSYSGSTASSSSGNKWDNWWYSFSDAERSWARRVGECESGNNPTIHGGGGRYHGAFQYLLSTWRSAPKTPGGDPHRYRWRGQAGGPGLKKRRGG